MTLDEMKNVDIRAVDPATLALASGISIDMGLPKRERMLDFMRQAGNPYCFRSGRNGNIAVKVSFADTAVSLDERMEDYLRML
jgi:hypothetical protein